MILDKSKPTGDPRVNVAAGQRLLELENFNRAEGAKKGEILLSAVFDSKPAFTVMSSLSSPKPSCARPGPCSSARPCPSVHKSNFRSAPIPLLRRHDAVGCDGSRGPTARLAAGASHADLRSRRQDAGLRLHRQGL